MTFHERVLVTKSSSCRSACAADLWATTWFGHTPLSEAELVADPDGADFVVVNTCGFIERARDESFAAVDEMLELKRQGRLPAAA